MNKERSVRLLLQGKSPFLGIFTAGQVLDKTPKLSVLQLFRLGACLFWCRNLCHLW